MGCQGSSVSKDDNLHEMCRYGAAELHAVASFIGNQVSFISLVSISLTNDVSWWSGGCAAQEVIKLLTKQYVPLDNTFVFNSVTVTTATLRL